ncbi:hypothetical protein J6590_017320 [Homalodisca vitripennis]|nr:hypothetical protein J6590_017320 [Homalodisca vitripennis]
MKLTHLERIDENLRVLKPNVQYHKMAGDIDNSTEVNTCDIVVNPTGMWSEFPVRPGLFPAGLRSIALCKVRDQSVMAAIVGWQSLPAASSLAFLVLRHSLRPGPSLLAACSLCVNTPADRVETRKMTVLDLRG